MTQASYQQKSYNEIRDLMQPGDIIVFGGNSLFSKWAKLTTRSVVTHVAVVIKTQLLGQQDGRYFNQVIEATDYNGKSGVMVNRLSDRVASYNGDIWWLH
jgi:cell wall-associated NlpC family hydrolase